MTRTMKTVSFALVGLVVAAALIYAFLMARESYVQESLQSGPIELSGKIVDNYASGGVGVGSGVTVTYQIKTDSGALVNLSYFTNPSLGPADPYTAIAPRIKTTLSVDKRVHLKGEYVKETNTISLDNEQDFVEEAR